MATLYVDNGYWVGDDYAQTGITIDWGNKNIFIPRSELTLIQSAPTVIYELNLNTFRLALTDLEDSEEGMVFPQTHRHNTTVVLSGVTYARVIEIINDYTVEFEDGQYAVNLVGANSNVADRVIVNQVSVRASNSAGLIEVNTAGGGGATAAEIWSYGSRTLTQTIPTAAENADAVRLELLAELVQLAKIAKLHGIGVDLTVTPTTRTAGDVSQTITTVGDTTTVSAA